MSTTGASGTSRPRPLFTDGLLHPGVNRAMHDQRMRMREQIMLDVEVWVDDLECKERR